jgi:hypothetical protein
LAGFQVTLIGRFWVTPEAADFKPKQNNDSCRLAGRTRLISICHYVSREDLHRYLWQFDFLWNNRQMKDGERTIAVIRSAEKQIEVQKTQA